MGLGLAHCGATGQGEQLVPMRPRDASPAPETLCEKPLKTYILPCYNLYALECVCNL
jgi:hypothetical protein